METVQTDRRGMAGFTLVELLIASTCMLLIVGAAYGIFSQQTRQTKSEEYSVEMQMNSKVAMERLHFIFTHAGFGCQDSFSSGISMSGDDPDGTSVTVTSAIWDIQNSAVNAGPDSVVVVYGFRKVGEVDGDHEDVNSLDIKNAEGPAISSSASAFKRYLCIFPDMDANQFYRVTGNSDPYTLEQTVESVPDDAAVYMVAPVRVMMSDERVLLFKNFVYGGTDDWEIADGIENLQLQYTIDGTSWSDTVDNPNAIVGVKIFLLVRSQEPEPGFDANATYTLAGQIYAPPNDHYHRKLHQEVVWIRNAQ